VIRGLPVTGAAVGSARFLLAVCPAVFVALLASVALAPFLPAVAADRGVSVTQVGQVPALMAAAAAVLGLVLGPLADRFGERRILAAGLRAAAVSSLGIGLASTFGLLAAAGLLVAVSRAAVAPVALALVGTRLPEDTRRVGISYVMASLSGVPIVGLPALTALASVAGGWRVAYVVLAVFALAVALLAFVLVPADLPRHAGSAMSVRGAYGPLLRHRPTLGLVGSSLLRNSCLWLLGTYWGAFLVQQYGFGLQQVGLGYSVMGVGHITGSLLLGRALRPATPARTLMALMTLLAGAAFVGAFNLPFGAGVALALAGAGAMMIGGVDTCNAVLLTGETPGGRSTTMTLNQSALSLGTAVGGAAGGLLLALGGYNALAAGLPIFATAAAVLVWSSRTRPIATDYESR
jgi:predicted MFS family arabinose efflux permease